MGLWKRRRPEPPLTEAERQFQWEHEQIMQPHMRGMSEIIKDRITKRKKRRSNG